MGKGKKNRTQKQLDEEVKLYLIGAKPEQALSGGWLRGSWEAVHGETRTTSDLTFHMGCMLSSTGQYLTAILYYENPVSGTMHNWGDSPPSVEDIFRYYRILYGLLRPPSPADVGNGKGPWGPFEDGEGGFYMQNSDHSMDVCDEKGNILGSSGAGGSGGGSSSGAGGTQRSASGHTAYNSAYGYGSMHPRGYSSQQPSSGYSQYDYSQGSQYSSMPQYTTSQYASSRGTEYVDPSQYASSHATPSMPQYTASQYAASRGTEYVDPSSMPQYTASQYASQYTSGYGTSHGTASAPRYATSQYAASRGTEYVPMPASDYASSRGTEYIDAHSGRVLDGGQYSGQYGGGYGGEPAYRR